VVDDGSKDKTYEKAGKQNVYVLKHIINRGQGASLQTGIDFALKKNADIIVTFDADGQHIAGEIKKLIMPIKKGEVEVTLGSRFLKDKNKKSRETKIPFIRKLFLKTGTFVNFIFYGVKLSDAHNGFRALSGKAAGKIQINCDGMEHASEIVEEIMKKNIPYKEVPVSIKYTNYSLNKGQRSLNAFRIFFKLLFRKLFR
jgi:glycosyltransferase involved in cell wall biosynthesis